MSVSLHWMMGQPLKSCPKFTRQAWTTILVPEPNECCSICWEHYGKCLLSLCRILVWILKNEYLWNIHSNVRERGFLHCEAWSQMQLWSNCREHNIFKGKILFSKQVKLNCFHKEHNYVEYDAFTANRPENKLLKATLIYLCKRTTSSKTEAI